MTNPWTLPDILTGVAQQCLAYPDTCAIGGNTGTVNSFGEIFRMCLSSIHPDRHNAAGVQVGDISGGLFNAADAFTDPAKLGCFLSQNIQAEAPSFLSNVFQGPTLQTVLGLVTSSLIPTLAKGFGACNGINVKGGNMKKGVPISNYASKYPGVAAMASNGPRAKSPSP